MATDSAIAPPPFTAEASPSAVVSPSPEAQQDPTLTPDPPSDSFQPDKTETASPPPPPSLPPLSTNLTAELKNLSAAIASFQQCYADLHNHLDSTKAAILSILPPETPQITPAVPSLSLRFDVSDEALPKPDKSEALPETETSEALPKPPDVFEETLLPKQGQDPIPLNSELESLCRTMCSRGIRRYLVTNLSNLPHLREQVPRVLKLAPNPPKLVLESLGKFYLQGSKAFSRNSPMIPAREASILALECFLLMIGVDTTNGALNIQKAVKEEAEKAALAWRKRMMVEGGVSNANQIDARGLLLFISCFGIPDSFKREDIGDLVVAGNAKEIVGVLQNSYILMNKIPEIVEGMVKNKMEVDAVNLVYTFGLEERFNPQTILVSYLRESKDSWKKPEKGSQGAAATLNEANKKQLASLKSICKCLERHKIDPTKLLPGWQINEKIATLEKDITDSDRKSSAQQKRKASETDTSKKPKTYDPKRSRYNNNHRGPQHPKAALRVHNSRLTNHTHNYPSSAPVVYGGPGAGLLPESMIPSGVGSGVPSSHGGMLSTVPYGGVMVDSTGQVVNHVANPYAWHWDTAQNERFAGQPSGVGLTSLYRGTTTPVEGFAGGVPNGSSVGVGSRLGSDLYQFADSVVESDSYPNSVPRSVGAVPSAVPGHHSSYLYQV